MATKKGVRSFSDKTGNLEATPAMNYDICPDCGAKPIEPDGVNTFVLHCPICGWELITIHVG